MPNNNEPYCPNIDYYVEWTREKVSKEETKIGCENKSL